MPEIIDCPNCGRRVRVPDSLLGKGVQCPSCEATFTAPAGAPPPAAVRERPAPPEEAPPAAPEPPEYEPWDEEGEYRDRPRRRRRRADRALAFLLPPAICLAVVAALGLAITAFNVVYALTAPVPKPTPNAPAWVQQIQKSAVGPQAAVIQAGFMALNALILVCAVFMMLRKVYGLALAGSILAMVNFGSLCCILGLPVGIWCLIVLCLEDVRAAFR